MKRIALSTRFGSIFLAIILVLGCQTITAMGAVDKKDAYAAYYEFITDEVNNFGQPIREPDYYRMHPKGYAVKDSVVEQIRAAYLLDVTGDGVEELILKRCVIDSVKSNIAMIGTEIDQKHTEWVCVYTYQNGSLIRIGQNRAWTKDVGNGSYSLYEPKGYIGAIVSSHQFPSILDDAIVWYRGNDGRVYFIDDSDGLAYVYTYDGSHMSQCKKFHTEIIWDWYVSSDLHSNHGKTKYYVDNAEVSRNEYDKKWNYYTGGGQGTTLVDNDYHVVLNQLGPYATGSATPRDWSASLINEAISNGYLPDDQQQNYNCPISRAKFCALATQYYEQVTGTIITELATFSDCGDVAVQKMAGLGVVSGVGNNRFAPYCALTRQQAATILSRLAAVMGISLPTADPTFDDNDKISNYAFAQVGQMQASGIMSGVGNNMFSPNTTYTREQSIVTLMQLDRNQAPVTMITFEPDSLNMLAGGNYDLGAVTATDTGKNLHKLVWYSSNPSIVSVSESGVLQANSGGRTTITAMSAEGVTASISVTVTQPEGRWYAELPVTVICKADPSSLFEEEGYDTPQELCITRVEEGIDENTFFVYGTFVDDEVDPFYADYTFRWILEDYSGHVLDGRSETIDYLTNVKKGEFELLIVVDYWVAKNGDGFIVRFKDGI